VSTPQPPIIRSAGNPQFKELRRLTQDSNAWRRQSRVWLEGEHLCRAAIQRGVTPLQVVFSESKWHGGVGEWQSLSAPVLVVADDLFAAISALPSHGAMGFILETAPSLPVRAEVATVILDRLQDAGNVGSILRCAAAFGFCQVIAIKGTAGLWSPKVIRAGMGAHFALHLVDAGDMSSIEALRVPILVTSSHGGELLHQARLPWPCAWVLGHEGQGVSPALTAIASMAVRIAQPGGEESLNVAAAAAICLHASAVSMSAAGPTGAGTGGSGL